MKKFIKQTAVVVVLFLALIGVAAGVAFASGYITWGGTDDYNAAKVNLSTIETKIIALKEEKASLTTEKDNLAAEVERLKADLTKRYTAEQIKQELITIFASTNKENGMAHKYDVLREGLNEMATNYGAEATDLLNPQGGGSDGSGRNELEQAVIDMKDIKGLTDELIEILGNEN